MGAVKRIAGGALFLIFILALAGRPLLSNPAIVGIIESGVSDWQTLLLALLVLLPAGMLLAARITAMQRDSTPGSPPGQTPVGNHWDGRGQPEKRKAAADTDSQQHNEQSEQQSEQPEPQSGQPTDRAPDILSGQGGTREREFGIEEEPPDAELSEHLDYLKTALDDEESRRELETLEEVVDEFEEENPIPARCPQDNCDAIWTERKVIGFKTEKYELLEDETVVRCLECEKHYAIE